MNVNWCLYTENQSLEKVYLISCTYEPSLRASYSLIVMHESTETMTVMLGGLQHKYLLHGRITTQTRLIPYHKNSCLFTVFSPQYRWPTEVHQVFGTICQWLSLPRNRGWAGQRRTNQSSPSVDCIAHIHSRPLSPVGITRIQDMYAVCTLLEPWIKQIECKYGRRTQSFTMWMCYQS